MRILQVLSSWKGGAIRVAFNVARTLVRRGHKVTIYVPDLWNENRDLYGTAIDEIVSFHPLCPQIAKKTRLYITPQLIPQVMKEVRYYDVVHLHGYRTFQNSVVYFSAKKYGIPYVLQSHGSLPRRNAKQRVKWIYDASLGYRLLRDASKVIALSPVEAQQYKGMGIPEEKIVIIPNGIDLLKYANLSTKGRFRERYGIEEKKKVVLYLGRINQFKGIDFLIDAFAYLIKKMKYDNAILVMTGPDDGYLDATQKLMRQHKIEDKILFTGPLFGIRKVEAYVDASIAASLDSLTEVVFLLVPLEAAACGTPVIVTKSNYIATLAEKGKFGSWVEYGNVPKLARMLREMLSNEALLREMGLNGRKFVSENFNWNSIVGMIEEVYTDVLKARNNVT